MPDTLVPQVTRTGADPAEAGAGAVQVIRVDDTATALVHAAPPTVTVQPAAKLRPRIVMLPPTVLRVVLVTFVTAGEVVLSDGYTMVTARPMEDTLLHVTVAACGPAGRAGAGHVKDDADTNVPTHGVVPTMTVQPETNPAPVMVKVGPPADVTIVGALTELTVGATDSLAVPLTETKPAPLPPHWAMTAAEPAGRAGVTQLIRVELTKVEDVQATPPTVKVHAGAKPVPLIMTTLPAAVPTMDGARLDTDGATYLRVMFEVEATPQDTMTDWAPAASKGAVQDRSVSFATTTFVQEEPPMLTVQPLMNPVPVMLAVKPPAVDADAEEAAVTVGAT